MMVVRLMEENKPGPDQDVFQFSRCTPAVSILQRDEASQAQASQASQASQECQAGAPRLDRSNEFFNHPSAWSLRQTAASK